MRQGAKPLHAPSSLVLMEHTMRSIFLSPAISCAVIGSAAANAPFAPVANVPDYVVTMVERPRDPRDYSRRVSHHGDWTRVDRMAGSNLFSTEYFSANGLAAIHIYSIYMYSPGTSVSFVRSGERSPNADTEPRRTGERQTHLGESCTVWDVRRDNGGQASGGFSHMSCITDDGIELWNKSIRQNTVISSAEATRVERRPVAPDDVRPPRALLMLDWWDRPTPAPIAQAIPDHETVMEHSSDAGHSIRTTRRHDSWQSVEETVNAVRHSLHIAHDSGRMQLSYESDDSGAPKRLGITKFLPLPVGVELPTSMQPTDLARTETVLGESCRWFDMTPGMQDAGRSACLTNDGIVLKEERSSWGRSRWTWTAIRLTRRAISLDEIKPSPALLEPRLWGIE
jgi:hypothetical protein